MKRGFRSLLLAVAMLAVMCAGAWAADGTIAIIKSVSGYSNGRISGGETNVYILNGADDNTMIEVGTFVTVTTGSVTDTIAKDDEITFAVKGADFDPVPTRDLYDYTGGSSHETYPTAYLSLPSGKLPPTTAFSLTYGWADAGGTSKLAVGGEKTLVIIPKRVSLDSSITITTQKDSSGQADISADFAKNDHGVVLNSLGDYGDQQDYVISYDKAGTPASLPDDGSAVVVGGLSVAYDADKFTLTVSNDQAVPAPVGAVELEICAIGAEQFKIDEGDLKGIKVAGTNSGEALGKITINVVDYIVTPASATWDASTASGGVKFTVKELTAEKMSKIEIKGSGVGPEVLDPANYTATTNGSDVEIELKLEYLEGLSKNDYTFTITDDSSKTASFALSVTPKAEASYAADPSSATWDGTSGVKFVVDMPHSDFNAIGVKSPNDEDVRELGKDYYTVTPTADGIEVELKAEYLLSLTATGDYVYYVGDKKGLSALFTLTVTGQGGVIVPSKGVEPQIDPGEAPKGVQFGISQSIMTKDEIVALDRSIGGFLDDDGKIKKDEAASLTRTDPEALTVLPIIAASLSEDKTVAAFTFGVTGRALVSEGTSGIKWYDAIIHKMYVGSTGPASVRLAPARTWGAVANGTYMIMDKDGTPLPEYHLIKREGETQYKLVVYVEDNSDYDLDKTNPKTVADPVAIQTSSGGRSKSSSGCDAGVFAPLACLAALGLVKRRAR